MTKSVFDFIRIIRREATFLDRKSGVRGEIFYDRDANTLRLFDGGNSQGGVALARSDLNNISNSDFLSKAEAAGVGSAGGGSGEITIAADDSTQQIIGAGEVFSILGGDGISTSTDAEGALTVTNTNNAFSTITVAGQDNIVADTLADTLMIAAGTNIILETDATTDTITISASAGASTNSFATIAVSGQSSVIADSATDTLTLVAGSGISLTTNSVSDEVTITSTISGATTFQALNDATASGLTIDKIYLPAITMLNVTNNGATSYRFDQYGSTDNPTVYAINRTTIAFNLDVSGHPFYIQDGTGTQYDEGVIHVTTSGTVTTGAAAQGNTSGTVYWKIPSDISGGYRYQCGVHAAMVGNISIKDFVAV